MFRQKGIFHTNYVKPQKAVCNYQLIEQYNPYVSQNNGIDTAKAIRLHGTANMDLSDSSGQLKLPTGGLVGRGAIISGVGATRTLTAAESGSLCLFDRAAGNVYTLPAPVVGLRFQFLTTVSVTTNSAKIITDAGTTFLVGSLVNVDTDSTNAVAAWTGNGSTHIAITQAAASSNATGGLIGSQITLTCVTSTLWLAEGVIQGAGTVATPFATS